MGGEIVLFGESALACHSCINPPIFLAVCPTSRLPGQKISGNVP
jgi:hypothetical protein